MEAALRFVPQVTGFVVMSVLSAMQDGKHEVFSFIWQTGDKNIYVLLRKLRRWHVESEHGRGNGKKKKNKQTNKT
jgi:hypothetical protein